VGINYVGTSTANPIDVAIDANGYAWVTSGSGSVLKLTPTGTHATGSPFTLSGANYIAHDPSGNVWITAGASVYETDNNGANKTGSPYTNSALATGLGGIATDGTSTYVASPNSGVNLLTLATPGQVVKITPSGGSATYNVFYTGITGGLFGGATLNNLPYVSQVANGNYNTSNHSTLLISGDTSSCLLSIALCGGMAVQQLDLTSAFPTSIVFSIPTWTTAAFVSGNAGSSSFSCALIILGCGAIETPNFVAADSSNTAWASILGSNGGADKIAQISTSGAIVNLFTGNGISSPQGVAVDGAGAVYVANKGANSLLQYASSKFVTYTGASNGTSPTTLLNTPTTLDIDPSGDVWLVNAAGSSGFITEFIGLATPVVRPLSAAAVNNKLGTRPL
jgi:streptogramin lyase